MSDNLQSASNLDSQGGFGASVAGKYLTFALGAEDYGIEILKVIEIIGMMHVTRVPRCPDYVKGVIKLRGKIIPVMDLRMKFGMASAEYNEKTCTIIVNVWAEGQEVAIGMIVDTVDEVVDFEAGNIEPPPEYGVNLDTRMILGIGKGNEGAVVILIDIDKVLSGADTKVISEAAQEEVRAEE